MNVEAPITAGAHAARSRAHIALINLTLVAAAALLLIGFFAPLFTLTKFLFFSNTVSLASGLATLLREGELALFTLLFAFGVLFPVAKLSCLFYAWNRHGGASPRVASAIHRMDRIGKWSMLDVFVVAILVVSIKLGVLADAEVRFGVLLFAASVLLTMLASTAMTRCTERSAPGASV